MGLQGQTEPRWNSRSSGKTPNPKPSCSIDPTLPPRNPLKETQSVAGVRPPPANLARGLRAHRGPPGTPWPPDVCSQCFSGCISGGHLANEKKIALGMAQLLAPTSARLLWAMINAPGSPDLRLPRGVRLRLALAAGQRHGGTWQKAPRCPRVPWGVLAPRPLPACTPPALLAWGWDPQGPVCAPVGKGLR